VKALAEELLEVEWSARIHLKAILAGAVYAPRPPRRPSAARSASPRELAHRSEVRSVLVLFAEARRNRDLSFPDTDSFSLQRF